MDEESDGAAGENRGGMSSREYESQRMWRCGWVRYRC